MLRDYIKIISINKKLNSILSVSMHCSYKQGNLFLIKNQENAKRAGSYYTFLFIY